MSNNRGDIIIALAVGIVAAILIAGVPLQFTRSSLHRQQQRIESEFEGFPVAEMGMWQSYFKKNLSTLAPGSYSSNPGLRLDQNLSSLTAQSTTGAAKGTPFNARTTSAIDPNPVWAQRLVAGSVNYSYQQPGGGVNRFCGGVALGGNPRKKGACLSENSLGSNLCTSTSFCDGKMACKGGAVTAPVTPISTQLELASMQSDRYYRLTQNLVLTGKFHGPTVSNVVLDGGGYSITGLDTENPSLLFSGLFSNAENLIVKDLILINPRVMDGSRYAGVLVGSPQGDICIERVRVEGAEVKSATIQNAAGGLVGGSTVVYPGNLYFVDIDAKSKVSSTDNYAGNPAGGITAIGGTVSTYFKRVHWEGEISGAPAGGLLGSSQGEVYFYEVSAKNGKIAASGQNTVIGGGIAGYVYATAGEAKNVRVQNVTIEGAYPAGSPGSYGPGGLGGGFGLLASLNPALNYPVDDLKIDANVKLENNGYAGGLAASAGINLSNSEVKGRVQVTRPLTGNKGVQVAGGIAAESFGITQLNNVQADVVVDADYAAGLFGQFQMAIGKGGVIQNTVVKGAVHGNVSAGGIAASAFGNSFNLDQVQMQASVDGNFLDSASTYGTGHAAGIFGGVGGYGGGASGEVKLSNVQITGNVTNGGLSSGFFGYTNGDGSGRITVQNSRLTGIVKSLGGLAAGVVGNLTRQAQIENVRIDSPLIEGDSSAVGIFGYAGVTGSKVRKTSITSALTAKNEAAGIVGSANGLTVEDTRILSEITAKNVSGVLIQSFPTKSDISRTLIAGRLNKGPGGSCNALGPATYSPQLTATNAFWNNSIGGCAGGSYGTGVSDTDLKTKQASYVGFDFTSVWQFTSGSFPTLR